MHQRSLSVLQGASGRRTTQDGALGTGSGRRGLCPPRGSGPLWAWLLLGALVVPGAWSFLSEEQEELLVELHNYYRGQVSPSASAMLPLRWDPSLKVIAEGYAAKCIWNHNPELEDTGENLFAGTGSLDPREALEKWFLEHLDYDFQNNSCDEEQQCGHYTQMVWADTHRVGCAFHLCDNMKGLDWDRVSFLVCNYYPAGNYEDQRPFVEGEWCSRCPENLQKCENNLCVADTVEEEDDDDDEEEVDEEDVLHSVTSGALQPKEEEGDEVVVPPPGTSGPSLLPEEEEGKEVVVPPPGTSGPSLLPEEEEEEEVVDPYVQPATTTTPSITTATTTAEEDPEDHQPPATPALGTHPPEAPSTTQEKEEKTEEKMKDEKTKETSDKTEAKERDVTRNLYTKSTKDITNSADSASSASLLLACLTGILTLRL